MGSDRWVAARFAIARRIGYILKLNDESIIFWSDRQDGSILTSRTQMGLAAVRLMPWTFLVCALVSPLSVIAQPSPIHQPSPLSKQLDSQRAIIINVDDSQETRVGQAEAMLASPSKQAIDLAVNLLSAGDEPSTKLVVCLAIARIARDPSARLDARLVDPLLALLKHPSDELSEAASRALSWFQGSGVFESLGRIVGRQDASSRERRAALSAMARNTDRRAVVSQLIGLLNTIEPQMRPAILDALSSVGATHDGTVSAWQAWWKKQGTLNEAQWLRLQLSLKSRRLALRDREFQNLKTSSAQQHERTANRLKEALTAQYRLTPADQKDKLLIDWLNDATADARMVSAGLVAEQISEGNPPSDGLRASLRERFNDPEPAVRKTSLEIVGALNDPADASPMLTRLTIEFDPVVRETILSMLGKLRSPDAVEPLINEITRENSPDACAAAASDALGMLAAKDVLTNVHIKNLIAPLRSRFAATDGASQRLKVALLGAMAAIGSAEFKHEFEANLSATDPEMLLQAIQGVAIVGNGKQLDRLSELVAHADARVRQRAIAALGALGTIDQVPTVVARLDPSTEKVEGPRRQAWLAFGSISTRLTVDQRVSISDKLSDFPNLLTEYLAPLEADLVESEPPHPRLPDIQQRLAETYVGLGRNVEALPYWRKLYTQSEGKSASERIDVAIELFKSSLSCNKTEDLPDLLAALTKGSAETIASVQNGTIQYLDALSDAQRLDELESLSAALRTIPLDAYPLLKQHLDAQTVVSASTNGLERSSGKG